MQSFRHCWRPQRQRAARRMQHVGGARFSMHFGGRDDVQRFDDLTANRPRTEGSGQCGTYAVSAQRWRLSSGQSIRAPSAVGPTAGEALPTHQRHRSRLRARAISAYECKSTMQHTHAAYARTRTPDTTCKTCRHAEACISAADYMVHVVGCMLQVGSYTLSGVAQCMVWVLCCQSLIACCVLSVARCTLHVVS
jgi:hypothetical protein